MYTMNAIALDPKIPFLADALDRHQAQAQLQTLFPDLRAVTTATLVRHKPRRRALIQYQILLPEGSLTILGKIRAKGTDWYSYHMQQALWNHGWAADSPDGLSIPEPLGVIPAWHMGLQRWVAGVAATDVLPTPAGIPLAHRIAALAHKLHRTPISTPKTHTLADELRILHDRLPLVADQYPQWRSRLAALLHTCDTLTPPPISPANPPTLTLIHRDFYPDQVRVQGDRLWLLDLDLCCQGDPALDIGNFIAHITEQSLRDTGDAATLEAQAVALTAAFIQIGSPPADQDSLRDINALRLAIEQYTVLSLVRHIHISTRIATRRPLTASILALCEQRLRQVC